LLNNTNYNSNKPKLETKL